MKNFKPVLLGLCTTTLVLAASSCATGAKRWWGTPDYQSSYMMQDGTYTTETHHTTTTTVKTYESTPSHTYDSASGKTYDSASGTYVSNPATTTTTTNESTSTYGVKGDNSKVNERIENNSEWTAQDQGSSPSDIKTTQEIRKQVVDQKSFSTYAKNVKIITRNGLVVIKGPVKTMSEKNTIDSIAKKVAGYTNVTNVITVTK